MSEAFTPLTVPEAIAAAHRIYERADAALTIRRALDGVPDRELISIVILARQLDEIARAAAAVPMTPDEAAFVMVPADLERFAALRRLLGAAGYLPLPETQLAEEPPMARAKTRAAGINLPVPQSDAEAEQMIARLGASQRDQAEAQARHDAVIAAHEAEHGKALRDYQDAQAAMIEGLSIWASANRERLTQGGKSKTVQLPTGKVLWREGRYAVKHRGLKVEDVAQAIQTRIAEILGLRATERRKSVAVALDAEADTLGGMLRRTVAPNKDAMLAAREVAEKIPGVTIERGPEEFVVEPLGSQIREVA